MSVQKVDDIIRLVFQSAEALYLELNRVVKPYNLTFEQWVLLNILVQKDGISQKVISEMVHKDQANITRILRRLSDKGFVERRDSTKDRRLNLIYITETGRQILQSLIHVKTTMKDYLYVGFSKEEQVELTTLLEKFLGVVKNNSSKFEYKVQS